MKLPDSPVARPPSSLFRMASRLAVGSPNDSSPSSACTTSASSRHAILLGVLSEALHIAEEVETSVHHFTAGGKKMEPRSGSVDDKKDDLSSSPRLRRQSETGDQQEGQL